MHPKDLVAHFEKMVTVYYILWPAVFEILEFETQEFLIF